MKTSIIAAVSALSFMSLMSASMASAQVATSTAVVSASTSAGSGANVIAPGKSVTIGSFTLNQGSTISELPVSLNVTGGGAAGDLQNCQLFGNGTALNSGTRVLNPVQYGLNVFPLDVPIGVQNVTLTIRCDVLSSTPQGTSFEFVVLPGAFMSNPSSVSGTISSNTNSVNSGTVEVTPTSALVSATGTGSVSTVTDSQTPGIPNTGAGGNAAGTLMLLIASGLAALLGGSYLVKRFA